MSIQEPVQKEFRDKFVKADQDLMWLSDHGYLDLAEWLLASLRELAEDGEKAHTVHVAFFNSDGKLIKRVIKKEK